MTNKHENNINLNINYKEGFMKKLQTLLFTLAAISALTGCENSDVKLVKKGTMTGYPNTTIGKAFDASFDNPKWEALETNKGAKVVQFTGNISKQTHDNAVYKLQTGWKENQGDASVTVTLFSMALQKIIGKDKYEYSDGTDSPIIQNLLTKYNCKLEYIAPMIKDASCKDMESRRSFMDSVFQELVDSNWEVGTAVRVEWQLHQNGEGFDLSLLENSSWEGIQAKDILGVIFN